MTTPKKTAEKKTPKPKTKAALVKAKKREELDKPTGRPIDDIIMRGDITSIPADKRPEFLSKLALSCGLNPMTQPFELMVLDNKLTIYARKGAADQLRKLHKISSKVTHREVLHIGDTARDDVYMVWVRLSLPDEDGNYFSDKARQEDAVGAVGIAGITDDALGNALMKCHTKALRRGTLAFWGLGFLDELEVESAKAIVSEGMGVGQPRRFMPTINLPPQHAAGIAPPTSAPPTIVVPPPSGQPESPKPEEPPAAPQGEIVILPPGKAPVSTKED
jgi:hypothetical protein